MSIAPFAYPKRPHRRRHGPKGYKNYRRYLNWLRDEFGFRCVYCLYRETWAARHKDWQIDHFIPKSIHPAGARDYDNLVLSCGCCNHSKAAHLVIDPCKIGYGTCVEVHGDGTIHALNPNGVALIEVMGLDDDDYNEFRRQILLLVEDLPKEGKAYQKWFGYPCNLPDLSLEPTPPLGNGRPAGIRDSHCERRKRGDLLPLAD